jgi:hypothetical protein
MLRALLSSIVLFWAQMSAFAADPTLTEREAQDTLQRVTIGRCVTFVVGEYNFVAVEAMQGGGKYETVQTLIALKEIGIVSWTDLPGILGWAHFNIELRSDIDHSQIVEIQSRIECLYSSLEAGVIKVIKVENVKGGATRWDGAIVYATITIRPTELYVRYLQARQQPVTAISKSRYLYRYDPFKQTWNLKYRDSVGIDQTNFTTSNVPDGLRED